MTRLQYLGLIALFGVLVASIFILKPRGIRSIATSSDSGLSSMSSERAHFTEEDIRHFCESPYKTICHTAGLFEDPTGIVRRDLSGEVRALRLYEEIIHKHPDWTSEEVDDELVRILYTPKRVKRIQKAERWVKNTLIQFIRGQPATVFSDREKEQLVEKLNQTKLELPPPASLYGDERDLFTKNDVFFERVGEDERRLRVGGAYLLTAKSYFNQIFTIAHELAHSIDPCELKEAKITIPQYAKLAQCFIEKKWVTIKPGRVECGSNDQTPEVFADWLAAQVSSHALRVLTANYERESVMNAVANTVRDLCEQEESLEDLDFESHPTPQTRIRKIVLAHPLIRHILECRKIKSPDGYCGMEMITLK